MRQLPVIPAFIVLVLQALVLTVLMLTVLGPTMLLAQSTACFEDSPAIPVPRFGGSIDSVELWPQNFRPADPAGQALPVERDSTGYPGFGGLGAYNGFEFFKALDILESGEETYLYMAYNSGWQIWNITGEFADRPFRRAFLDGWDGQFHEFQGLPTEFYFLIQDIDAIDPPNDTGGIDVGKTLVALAATEPVGFSIWDAESKGGPFQLYQNMGHPSGEAVATANIGGHAYAFAGSGGGIEVYDLTRAREVGPCFEDIGLGETPSCGGSDPVYRGSLDSWGGGRARYVDVLQVGARTFVAASDAFNGNGGLEIHEIIDPATASGRTTLEGLGTLVYGTELFSHNRRHYVSLVQVTTEALLEIYDITDCLESGTACNFNDREVQLPTAIADFIYTQFSTAEGRPFLYQGLYRLCNTPPTAGKRDEMLLDLSDLEGTLDADDIVLGGSYPDPTVPEWDINYWTYYYAQATSGYSLFGPQHGMFHGRYFYRAAQSVFDVHRYTGPTPQLFMDGFESGGTGQWSSVEP